MILAPLAAATLLVSVATYRALLNPVFNSPLSARFPMLSGVASVDSTTVRFEVPAGVTASEVLGVVPAGATADNGRIEFTTRTPTADVNALTGWALARGLELPGLVVARPTLEDVFLGLAGAEQPAEAST